MLARLLIAVALLFSAPAAVAQTALKPSESIWNTHGIPLRQAWR